MKKYSLILMVILFWGNYCVAETFCVSQEGSTDCGGAPGANRLSVDDFNASNKWDADVADDGAIGPGDTVYLSGELRNPVGVNHGGAVLNVQQGGTVNNPLTIVADPNNSPTIYGAESVGDWDWKKKPGSKNIWQSAGQPSMLWDTKGTSDFSDDVALMENQQLAQLADNETGWYQADNIVLLKLAGNDAPTADIEATVARGLSIIHTAPIAYISIGDDSHSITFEKCGGLGLKQNGILLGAITTSPHPVNNFEINNCKINRSIGMAVYLWGGGEKVEIYDNTIDTVIPRYGNYGGEGAGIMVIDPSGWSAYNPPKYIEIYNNEVSRTHFGAIVLGGGEEIKIYGNYLHDIPLPRYDNTKFGPYCWGSSIHLEAEYTSTDPLVTRFFKKVEIYENTLVETGDGITVSGRKIDNGKKTEDIKIYNNTIVKPQGVPWASNDGAISYKYAENVRINNNTIISPAVDGINVGPGHGKTYSHDIKIYDNIIYEPGNYLINARLSDVTWSDSYDDLESYNNALYSSDWKNAAEYTSNNLNDPVFFTNWFCFVSGNECCSDCYDDENRTIDSSIDFSDSFDAIKLATNQSKPQSGMGLKKTYKFKDCTAYRKFDRKIAENYTFQASLYFDRFGQWEESEFFNIKVDSGDNDIETSDYVLDVYFSDDGIRFYDDQTQSFKLIAIEDMTSRYSGKWGVWKFSVQGNNVTRIRVNDEDVLNTEGSYATCLDCLEPSDLTCQDSYPIKVYQQSDDQEELVTYIKHVGTVTDIVSLSGWQEVGFDVVGSSDVCGSTSDCPEGYVCESGLCELNETDDPPVIGSGPFVAAGLWPVLPKNPTHRMSLDKNYKVLWTFSDDDESRNRPCSHQAEYKAVDGKTWTALDVSINAAGQSYAYVTLPVESLAEGKYVFRFSITDCAYQTIASDTYFFEVASDEDVCESSCDCPEGYICKSGVCELNETDGRPVIGVGPFVAGGWWPVLPTNPASPMSLNKNYNVVWAFSDDYESCSGLCSHQAEYKAVDEKTWSALDVGTDAKGQAYAYVTLPVDSLEDGMYSVRFSITDCACQTITSNTYFFEVVQ